MVNLLIDCRLTRYTNPEVSKVISDLSYCLYRWKLQTLRFCFGCVIFNLPLIGFDTQGFTVQ